MKKEQTAKLRKNEFILQAKRCSARVCVCVCVCVCAYIYVCVCIYECPVNLLSCMLDFEHYQKLAQYRSSVILFIYELQ